MGQHFSATPFASRSGAILIVGIATFSIGLIGGFVSGLRSERVEHEREAHRSKYAVEQAGHEQRDLERRILDLESQLSASREEAEKWRAMKPDAAVQNTRK